MTKAQVTSLLDPHPLTNSAPQAIISLFCSNLISERCPESFVLCNEIKDFNRRDPIKRFECVLRCGSKHLG